MSGRLPPPGAPDPQVRLEGSGAHASRQSRICVVNEAFRWTPFRKYHGGRTLPPPRAEESGVRLIILALPIFMAARWLLCAFTVERRLLNLWTRSRFFFFFLFFKISAARSAPRPTFQTFPFGQTSPESRRSEVAFATAYFPKSVTHPPRPRPHR